MIYTLVFLILLIPLGLTLRNLRKSGPTPREKTVHRLNKPAINPLQPDLKKLKEIRNSDLPEKLSNILGDRYSDIVPISVGGMGVVAQAWDIAHGRKVAIKTVLPDLEKDPRAIELFFTECNAVQKMNHPNIVKIYEVGEKDVLYYYVMEFLEGESLNITLKREPRLSPERVIRIGLQAARAVQHCHDNRVIHRDIKPANLFMTRENIIKIVDFGIVKMISGDASVVQGTTKVGSPEFASPEQIQGQKVSGKSDIYSLGVCLFNMLSGEMPFKTSDLFARMFDSPRNLKDLCPGLPDKLVRIVHTCIDLDPAKRYTGMQLWTELKALEPPR